MLGDDIRMSPTTANVVIVVAEDTGWCSYYNRRMLMENTGLLDSSIWSAISYKDLAIEHY